MDFLGGKTIIQKGTTPVTADVALKKKNLILYYFTIQDNELCKNFDEKLKEVYSEAVIRKVELAVIVVPNDTDKVVFENTIKTRYEEWFSLNFGDELIQMLIYNYGISHVPALVVVRKNGELVTKTGVKDVENLGINVLVTWSS